MEFKTQIKLGGVWRDCEQRIPEDDAARLIKLSPDYTTKDAAKICEVSQPKFRQAVKKANAKPNAFGRWPLATLKELKGAL